MKPLYLSVCIANQSNLSRRMKAQFSCNCELHKMRPCFIGCFFFCFEVQLMSPAVYHVLELMQVHWALEVFFVIIYSEEKFGFETTRTYSLQASVSVAFSARSVFCLLGWSKAKRLGCASAYLISDLRCNCAECCGSLFMVSFVECPWYPIHLRLLQFVFSA